MSAAPPPNGTPVEQVTVETYQLTDALTPELTLYAGLNSEAARVVSAETGENGRVHHIWRLV